MHTQFIGAVGRGPQDERSKDVRAIANGKVWTGQQAFTLKNGPTKSLISKALLKIRPKRSGIYRGNPP